MKRKLKSFLKHILDYAKRRIVARNIFKTSYTKNALLSYVVLPFTGAYKYLPKNHTNLYEAQFWAQALRSLKYNVDVINYDSVRRIRLERYDLLCGFGDVFQDRFENWRLHDLVTIYYGTGMHVVHQNHASLMRIKDVHAKTGVWLGKSARFVEKTWSHQTTLVSGMIVLGDRFLVETYKNFYDGPIYLIPAFFLNTQNAERILEKRSEKLDHTLKNFLWFGSSGLVHKGLDLLLEVFSQRSDLRLHICGPLEEEGFLSVYRHHLYETKNITAHGFVDIKSKKFAEILSDCNFVIFPSCSEGGAVSVLTAIGNGALMPIVSRESTVSVPHKITIETLDIDGVNQAINEALAIDQESLLGWQLKNLKYVLHTHSQKRYLKELTLSADKIISKNNDVVSCA